MLASQPSVGVVLRPPAVNGQRPGWDDTRSILYFVDMRAPALHAFTPDSGRHDW